MRTDVAPYGTLDREGVYGDIDLPYDRAVELLQAIVAKQPDRITTVHCYYVDGEPNDILGHLMTAAGFTQDADLRASLNHPPVDGVDARIGIVYHRVFAGHLKTAALLERIQRSEFHGKTWAKAVALAKNWVETHPAAWNWIGEEHV